MSMVSRGRIPEKERTKAISGIAEALEKNPEGLGVRELRSRSGIGSFETLYKYLDELTRDGKIVFHEENVGRGKPKKTYTLSEKGIAHSIEFKVMEYFEKIRESCKKNEQIELDNYAFSYAIYGMPKNLNEEEKKQATLILKKINSALLDLDEFRNWVINKEANKYRVLISRIYSKIFQSISQGNEGRKTMIIDNELGKETWSYIPPSIKRKMRLDGHKDFAIVATRGPSFIDEFSLRPENHLLWLIQTVERWDDEGLDFVIGQLARNKYVDQEAINRIRRWDIPARKISNYYWQKLMDKLESIPKIREEMRREKEDSIRSGNFKHLLGISEAGSIVVTKAMLGRERLDEIRRELSNLE